MALVEEGAAPSEQQTHHRNGHRNRQQQHYTLATCYLLPPTYHPPTTHLPPTYYPPTTHLLLTYYPIPGYTTYKLRVAIYYHHCYEASVAKKNTSQTKNTGERSGTVAQRTGQHRTTVAKNIIVAKNSSEPLEKTPVQAVKTPLSENVWKYIIGHCHCCKNTSQTQTWTHGFFSGRSGVQKNPGKIKTPVWRIYGKVLKESNTLCTQYLWSLKETQGAQVVKPSLA